jgi:flagellin
MYINTNVASLFAQNAVNATDSAMQTQEQELSTGYAINSPSDNPSGLAISNLMQGQLGGISAATQNANQALNLLQTANGGMQTDVSIVQKIQQLAVQASNGTQTTQDQQDIQSQINNLLTQVDNNAATINYNGLNVLNGSFGATTTMATTASDGMNVTLGPDSGNAPAGSYAMTVTYNTTANTDTVAIVNKTSGVTVATGTYSGATTATNAVVQMVAGTSGDNTNASFVASFNAASVSDASGATGTSDFTVTAAANPLVFQVGATQGAANEISASLGAVTSQSLGLASVSVVGQDNAQNAVTLATNALSMLTNAQGALGSQEDQLNYTISNLQTESVNLQSAQSTIMDANMATVSSQFAQSQILQQTGLQALATANALPDQVVKLLG